MSDGHTPDIRVNFERVATSLIREAAEFPAAILADVYGRRGAVHGRVAPLSGSMRLAGSAVTVEVRPGDNLMIHAAVAIAKPGDVIVVDGKGDQSCAVIGEIIAVQAQATGVAGFVVDAAARDVEALRERGYPIFSAGSNPCGPTKRIGGRVNWPVSCGGVTVFPGDLVVGDADGVVVIERERVQEILALARKKLADEAKRMQGISEGRLVPPWLASALREAGVTSEQ
jgi:4-hydroxy-4-methyl-2-oxoglutarate aldolase